MITRYTNLLLTGAILLITSCKGDKTYEEGYYFQDFENLKDWVDDSRQITNEFAKSGSYSSKMDEFNAYSNGFKLSVADIKSKGFKKAKVRAWGALSEPNAKCKLVTTIENAEKTIYWNGISFNDFISNPKDWGLVQTEVNFDKADNNSVFKVYAINDGKEKAYLDDVEIQLVK